MRWHASGDGQGFGYSGQREGQKSEDAAVPMHLWDAMWRLRRREAGLPSMKGWRGRPREVAPKSTLPR